MISGALVTLLARSDSSPTLDLTPRRSKKNLSILSTTHDDPGPWLAHAEETTSAPRRTHPDIDDTPVTI